MSEKKGFPFAIRKTQDADVLPGMDQGSWNLKIPSGSRRHYRLAQLDDYTSVSRDRLAWKPPLTLKLRARTTAPDHPGTWGFGFWNDPFSLSLGLGGGSRRFPSLPNAAWFFFASPQNYLSFRSDLPAKGFIAQTFHSPNLPAPLLGLGALAFPFLLWPWLSRRIRLFFRHIVKEDSFPINIEFTQWNSYTLEWRVDQVTFQVGDQIFETTISPNSPLGFVLWIDNQYAAFPPNGRLSYGTLANPQPACLEIEALTIE